MDDGGNTNTGGAAKGLTMFDDEEADDLVASIAQPAEMQKLPAANKPK